MGGANKVDAQGLCLSEQGHHVLVGISDAISTNWLLVCRNAFQSNWLAIEQNLLALGLYCSKANSI